MTLEQLQQRVTLFGPVSYGHYKVEINYRKKIYSCTTTNTIAVDVIKNDSTFYYKKKQAYKSLYDECKEKNDLF